MIRGVSKTGPRKYPEDFGLKVREILPIVLSGGECGSQVSPMVSECLEAFRSYPYSTWDEARLTPCLRYLRGNKDLDMPQAWKHAIPLAFEMFYPRESSSDNHA